MGEGSEIQTVGDAKWNVDTVNYNSTAGESTVTLEEPAIVKDGYGLIDGKTIYFGNETEGWQEVLSTSKPNQLTVSGDASAIAEGYFKEGANKNDVIFLEDKEALDNVGLKEEKFSRPDIPPYANLTDDAGIAAAMSDWSNGLPVGIEKIDGAETVSQEGSDLFVKHGTNSAKVECNAEQGLQTIDIDLKPEDLNPYFSTTVYLQVETGGVRIELIDADGKTHPTDQLAETNVNETRAIKIGGAEPAAGPAKIKIIAQSDNTVFYLDAITLTQSSYALPYAPLMGPKALWIEAGKHLKKYGGDRPDVWNGQVMDDAYFGSGSKEIEIGSFVKVQEDWNEGTQSYDSEFTVRVVELSYSEDRNNGRYKKTVRLADKNTQASRFFQEQYLTTESQQQSLGVRDVPNKPIIDRDNAVIEGGTPRFEQVEIYPDTGKPPLVLGSNAQGELVTGFNADLLGGYHAADFIREDIENTFSAKQTFNDEARFNSFARFKTDGRIQGDGGGAVEVLANDGTNTGILRVDKIIVNNLEVAEDIDQTNTNELRVEDQYIVVNEGQTGTPSLDGGLYAERGDQSDAYLYFDEGNDDWGKKFGSAGTFDKAIFKSDIFPNDSIQGLGASDSPTWAGATFTGFVEITTGGNQNLNQRRTNWDAGDYFGTHVSGQPTNAILQHRFWDESVSSYINIVDFKRNGDADFYGDVTTEMLYTTSSEGGFYIKDSRSTPKWFADFLLKTTSNGIPYLSIDTDKTERIKIDHNSGIVNIIEGIDIAGNPFVDSALALTAGTGDFSDDLYTAGALTVDLDASLKDDVFTHATIGSPDFASKTTDWQITKAGHGDFRSIYSDEIRTEAFIAEISEALAGADFLTKSRGVLSRNFQVPSNGNTGTLYVEDLEGFQNSRVFSAGNTIRLRVIDKSGGGLVVANIWGTVSNYSDLSGGEQSWTFTTTDDGGSAGGTIYAGSVALDYGVSGDGYIERTTLDQSGSPYSQTVTWEDTTGNNIPDSYTVLTRIGVLDGLAGLSGAGMYAKDNVYFEFGSGDLFIVGKNAGGTGKHGVHIDSNNYHYGTGEWKVGDGTYYLQKKADGSLDSQLQSYHWDAQDLSIDSTYGIEVANTHELLNDGTFDFAGGILTGTTTSITGAGWDWTSSSLKKGTDIVLDATNKRITLAEGTTDEMSFGYGVGGTGLHGMHLDSNNYWYSGKDFKVHVDSNNFISVLQGSGVNVKATQFLLDSSNVQIGDTSGWLGASNILSYSSNSVGFAGFTADSNKISANTGSDFWDGANNEFQFGGTDGISFPVNGNVKVGSGVDIFGNLDVSTLPRINDDGLVGLWRFDEGDGTTVINSTGNKNGTINGATDAKGISGRSLDFDGTNDYVSIPNYSQLNNISFTISAWIYPTASTGDHVIFYKIDGGNSGYGLRLQGLTPQFFVMDSGSSLISSTEDVTVNKWNHIIATYDGSNTEIFVNAKSTATGTGTITTNAIDASIGARNDSLSQYFEGRIDEVRFYNRAIDLSEVKSLYANPSGTSGGLISANQLRTGRIESTNLSYTGGTYTADGMLIDLDAGVYLRKSSVS
ncbi:LamG domain-containing protein [Fodinibius sp.]|uniref:LamG domain-containing protein n=1 Tax=Fodinibius sp. TaxID=1872440 RepID=UPI002ACDFF67|nr:LamG domain-containing protein [Fodinibius sp.]MDZ7658095.1 LamG domain-containing protein [Fodinibius sp.]